MKNGDNCIYKSGVEEPKVAVGTAVSKRWAVRQKVGGLVRQSPLPAGGVLGRGAVGKVTGEHATDAGKVVTAFLGKQVEFLIGGVSFDSVTA